MFVRTAGQQWTTLAVKAKRCSTPAGSKAEETVVEIDPVV